MKYNNIERMKVVVKHIFPPKLFQSVNKSSPQQAKTKDEGIIATKTVFTSGSYVNDEEIESRTEYFLYSSGKILSKCYLGECLCMISISKDSSNIFGSALESSRLL